jgi:hypothetical protein
LQLPFGRVKVDINDGPSTDSTCALFVHFWNGDPIDEVATSLISCDAQGTIITHPDGSTWIGSGALSVQLMRYSPSTSSSNLESAQPVCGVDPDVMLTTSTCTQLPTASVSDWATFKLLFNPTIATGTARVVLYVQEWNRFRYSDTSSPLLSYSKVVSDGSAAYISATGIGLLSTDFSYESTYKFEVAQFVSGADISTAAPQCYASGITSTAPTPECSGSFVFTRSDGESVKAKLISHSVDYGVCKIFITAITPVGGSKTTFETPVASAFSPQYGCNNYEYEFTSVAPDLDLADGATIEFIYKFYADKDRVSDEYVTCTKSIAQSYTILSYDIGHVIAGIISII